jgi:hypothetical protein
MKKVLLILVALLFTVQVAVAAAAGNQPQTQQSTVWYGCTENGVFFVHMSLVDDVEGETPPYLRAAVTGWQDVKMEKQGNYWVYNTHKHLIVTQYWCVNIGGDRYLPHELINIGSDKLKKGEVVDNHRGGFNFKTVPLKKLPF